MTTFIAQSRRPAPDARWRHVASGFPTARATALSKVLMDEMQRAGFRYSELHLHRDDLVAGHVLTAEDGTQFRILFKEEEPTNTDDVIRREAGDRWDDSLATLLVSTDKYLVETDAEATEDGGIRIRRTVWTKAYRRNDRHIVWMGDVAIIPAANVRTFVMDVIDARVAAG